MGYGPKREDGLTMGVKRGFYLGLYPFWAFVTMGEDGLDDGLGEKAVKMGLTMGFHVSIPCHVYVDGDGPLEPGIPGV